MAGVGGEGGDNDNRSGRRPPPVVVYGVESVKELVPVSKANLAADGKGAWVEDGRVVLRHGDGSQGVPGEKGPYAAIHVGAAAGVFPRALVEQLAAPGGMVVPLGGQGEVQQLTLIEKDGEGRVRMRECCAVQYVPLHMEGG